MTVRILKDTFSHASCKQAMALATKALMQKLASTPNLESDRNALTKDELDLLKKVQRVFAVSDDKGKK